MSDEQTPTRRRSELQDTLARAGGHRGAGRLRALLERRGDDTVAQSEAERLFLDLISQAGLPEPETQVTIAGFKVDFLWRKERVVFEVDGYRFPCAILRKSMAWS